MGWTTLKLKDSEYKKRLEKIRDGIAQIRDTYVEIEVKRIKNLADVMNKAAEHKEKKKKCPGLQKL